MADYRAAVGRRLREMREARDLSQGCAEDRIMRAIVTAAIFGGSAATVIAGAAIIWIALAAMVATYGRGRGFPFFPLLACGVFLGWPLVLLAVTIAPAREPS